MAPRRRRGNVHYLTRAQLDDEEREERSEEEVAGRGGRDARRNRCAKRVFGLLFAQREDAIVFVGREHEIGLIRSRLEDRSKAQLLVSTSATSTPIAI